MPDLLKSMTDGFMPHGYCLHWDGPLLFTLIVGNLGIALAYFLIPTALRYFVGQRRDLPYPQMFKLFAAFILSCGLTHIAKVWTLYQPVYWLEAALDVWTAIVSLVTAAFLFPLIPQALALRSARELEAANSKLEAEIVERKKAEEIAKVARDEAIRANKLKSEFVANISHEVRTPMSGILGMSELLMNTPDPADVSELSTQVHSSSKRLLEVLNALLDFSKLEAGKMQQERILFSLRTAIDESIRLVKPSADAKHIKLESSLEKNIPEKLIGDEAKIRQILLNYLHNAVKFTAQGFVKIDVETLERIDNSIKLKFEISDTGIGIDEKTQHNLFQPFVQGDGSTRRNFGGTGLGLSIAKQMVELIGGETGLTSEVGKGSCFWFTINLEVVPEQKPEL